MPLKATNAQTYPDPLSLTFMQVTAMVSPYVRAAKNKAVSLSAKINKEFHSSTAYECVIKPVFQAAAAGLTAVMDKISKMAKSGQLPWPKPGIGNGAYNKIIADKRKNGRDFRAKQSRSYRIV